MPGSQHLHSIQEGTTSTTSDISVTTWRMFTMSCALNEGRQEWIAQSPPRTQRLLHLVQPRASPASAHAARPANHPSITSATRHPAHRKQGHADTTRAGQNPLAKQKHTHSRKQQHRAHTQPGQYTIPASCRNPASRHSRCRAQARASGLEGAERAKTHSQGTRNTPRNLAASRGEAAERQR